VGRLKECLLNFSFHSFLLEYTPGGVY